MVEAFDLGHELEQIEGTSRIELVDKKPVLKESLPKFESTSLENIYTEKIEEKPIIQDLLYEGEQTVIYGDGGVGKSLVTEDISMSLGSGLEELWGLFAIPRFQSSMFIQSENGRLAVNQRTIKKCNGNSDYICGLPNIIYAGQFGNIQVAGHVSNFDFRKGLVDFIKSVEEQSGINIEVLFWDPLISFHDAEENDNSRMRSTLDQILTIANEAGATPIVVHHSNKEKGLRGASAIQNWARNIIKLEDVSYKGEKRIKFKHEKCNNHKLFEPFTLAMDEYLNFTHLEIDNSVSRNIKERCLKVLEALELLGGKAEMKSDLIDQYKELTGIKADRTLHRHINEAVDNNFIGMEYYRSGNSKKKMARYFLP
jgi:RecA-family ATPase